MFHYNITTGWVFSMGSIARLCHISIIYTINKIVYILFRTYNSQSCEILHIQGNHYLSLQLKVVITMK